MPHNESFAQSFQTNSQKIYSGGHASDKCHDALNLLQAQTPKNLNSTANISSGIHLCHQLQDISQLPVYDVTTHQDCQSCEASSPCCNLINLVMLPEADLTLPAKQHQSSIFLSPQYRTIFIKLPTPPPQI